MKFYALVLWRSTGTMPTVLQLIYLGNGEVLRYSPDESDLRATERKVQAVWGAVNRAAETGRLAAEEGPAVRVVLLPGRCARSSAARPRRCPRSRPAR